jgi:hypothetical protein
MEDKDELIVFVFVGLWAIVYFGFLIYINNLFSN